MIEKKFDDFNVRKIGNELEIIGIVYGNGKESIAIMLPDSSNEGINKIMFPDLSEWNQIIKQSDLLETELIGGDKDKKIILRKSTRNIDTKISWEVFRRDDYKCVYCGNDHVPLTVDHVVLWEEGGPTIPENLLTACKKCNMTRGNMDFDKWIETIYFKDVIQNSTEKAKGIIKWMLEHIPEIRANHLRVHKRNR